VLSSEAQSRHGRIITRMGTTDMDMDMDHIPITHHLPAATSGTVTPGYPPAKSKHAEVVDPGVSTKAESTASLAARCYFRTSSGSLAIFTAIHRAARGRLREKSSLPIRGHPASSRGDRASLFSPGAGEVAGSSPASVTISMKKAVRAEWASCGVEGHLGEIRNTDYGIREFGFVDSDSPYTEWVR